MQTMTVIGVIFGVLLAAFIIPGLIFGFQKLFAQSQKVESFKRRGYSIMFMRLLGMCEIVALTTLLFTQPRFVGIIFFCIILPGSVYTHLRSNDARKDVIIPVFVGLHLLAIIALNYFM